MAKNEITFWQVFKSCFFNICDHSNVAIYSRTFLNKDIYKDVLLYKGLVSPTFLYPNITRHLFYKKCIVCGKIVGIPTEEEIKKVISDYCEHDYEFVDTYYTGEMIPKIKGVTVISSPEKYANKICLKCGHCIDGIGDYKKQKEKEEKETKDRKELAKKLWKDSRCVK